METITHIIPIQFLEWESKVLHKSKAPPYNGFSMLASFLFLVGQSLDVNMNLYGSSVTKTEATQNLFAY